MTRTSGDGEVLATRMAEALETLKRSSGKQTFLYELPWYIIIGPPGAGKTTALVNSGPEIPAGRPGRRGLDRRRRRHALLRLLVHRRRRADRHRRPLHDAGFRCRDRQEELAVLPVAAQDEPHQAADQRRHPGDQRRGSADRCRRRSWPAHANAIRKRLFELHQELKIDFPVYALFTKADLIEGFREYFGNFTESRRRKVWGATFQTEDRKKNLVGAGSGRVRRAGAAA